VKTTSDDDPGERDRGRCCALSLSRGSFYGRWKKKKKKKSLDIAVALARFSPLRQRIARLFTGDTSYLYRGNRSININARLMRDIRAIYMYYDIMRRNLVTLYVYNLDLTTRHSSTRFLIKKDERNVGDLAFSKIPSLSQEVEGLVRARHAPRENESSDMNNPPLLPPRSPQY